MDSYKKLEDFANILRRDSIISTTHSGSGHPTSCLSCAEILSCLFFHEMKYDLKNPDNPDNDEFVLSKGHAAPILYSALINAGAISENILSLRARGSNLEGHPIPNSLKWIKVATGSLGQGLSIGAGMALANKIQSRKSKVFVLLGDSELSEGSIYEALQFAGIYSLSNLVAIADINGLGQTGKTSLGKDLSSYKKRFESFGWNVNTVNGHNIKEILYALKASRSNSRPTFILAETKKGKGVSFLENHLDWHGKTLSDEECAQALEEIANPEKPLFKPIAPEPTIFRLKNSRFLPNYYNLGESVSTREAFGRALAALAESDNLVFGVDAEVGNSTFLNSIKSAGEDRLIQCGISEQNMIGVSLGMSKKGLRVFSSTFSAFLTRAFDQLRMASYSDADFTVCGSHSGVSIGQDGASQMGLEDISMFRTLEDTIILYPSDAVSTEKLVSLAGSTKGIKYIRTTRSKTPVIYSDKEKFSLGDFKIIKSSAEDKIVLIGAGITLHESLKAHFSLLKKSIKSAVIDLYCIKPLDEKKLIKFIMNHGKKIIVSEDHRKEGGIGETLLSALNNAGQDDLRIVHLGVEGLPHSSRPEETLKEHHIDSDSIELEALKLLKSFN